MKSKLIATSRYTGIILILLMLFLSAGAQVLPFDTAVRYGKLPNGLTYFIRHNGEPKKRAVFYLLNNVGSILEDDDQRGLAHFMEHMSFNGTKKFPKNELIDFLQKSGIRFGADLNAHTSFDETVYQLPLPTDKPELVNKGLQIIREWAGNATLDPLEIDKERGVVLEEKRLRNGVSERFMQAYLPLILDNSRYADREPIGIDSVLNNFKRENIQSFYHDWYRPDLQAVIIVGDINVDQIEKQVKALFADLKNPVNERTRTAYKIPLTGENHFIALTDKEQTSRQLEIFMKRPATPFRTVADYREHLIEQFFNSLMVNRYAVIIHSANTPFLQGGASVGNFFTNIDAASITITADSSKIETGTKAIWREIQRIRQFGFTEAELLRLKNEFLSNFANSLREKDKITSEAYAEEYTQYFLRGIASMGIENEEKIAKQLLPAITLKDINDLTGTFNLKSNRDIIILAPESDRGKLPDERTVLSWLTAVANEKLTPYLDTVNSQPLTKNNPRAGKITSQTFDKSLNITTLKLSNGMTLLVKPTDFKNDEIMFSGFSEGGTSNFSDTEFQSAANAAGLMAAGGVGNFSKTQLVHFLQDKQVNAQPFISEKFYGISGRSNNADLELAMRLVYAFMTEPRKDSIEFKGIINRSIANLENRSKNPEAVFGDTIAAVLSRNNIRKTAPSLAKISQINLNQAYEIYHRLFSNASGFTFVIVGNVNLEKIKMLAEKYLAGLPAEKDHFHVKNLHIYPPAGYLKKDVFKGNEERATVILHYSGPFIYTNATAFSIDALKEVLEIRLLERLREDESGVYTPSVTTAFAKIPEPRFVFNVQFSCAPKNVEKLVASTIEEIGKIQSSGPLDVDLAKWKAESGTAFTPQLSDNSFWLNYLLNAVQNQQSFHQVDTYLQDLNKVDKGMIKDFAKGYLKPVNLIRFDLLPEPAKTEP